MNKSRLLLLLLGVGMIANSIAAPPQVALTVTVQGEGTVTSDPAGIDCREGTAGCSENFKKSTTVTLTAEADPESTFLGWTDSDACAGTDPECATKVTNPTTVTAIFDTATVTYPAPVEQTGQTSCYNTDGNIIPCEGSGQDGEYQAGVPSPNPRFIDNLNGTVTDNLTGIIWLKDHNCTLLKDPDGEPSINPDWQTALDQVALLSDGNCGLSDGSQQGDWVMPNVNQLASLYNWGNMLFGMPYEHPFDDFSARFWSSTTHLNSAWWVQFGAGISRSDKILGHYRTWAVRGPN